MIKNLKNKKKKKAFTLIELIIVIAIIAILAAIALPKFGDVRRKANISADIANAKQIQSAVSLVIAEGNYSLPTGFLLAETPEVKANVATILDDEVETTIPDIKTKTIEQLQGAIPTIKTGDDKGKNFYVDITEDAIVTITAGSEDGTQIYPNGADPYNQ